MHVQIRQCRAWYNLGRRRRATVAVSSSSGRKKVAKLPSITTGSFERLRREYGLGLALALIIALALGLLLYFWFGR